MSWVVGSLNLQLSQSCSLPFTSSALSYLPLFTYFLPP